MATDISQIDLTENRVPRDALYEVIDGQIVELPPMGTRQEITAGKLHAVLARFVDEEKLGFAVMETLFDFTQQLGKKRRPDVAFVAFDRWPASKPIPEGDGWQVVPNLAAEVVSRNNAWDDVQEKVSEYFQVGVQRTWVISTKQRQIHVYDAPTSVKILTENDVLTDEQLLPGFRLALGDLFPLESQTNGQP